MNGNTSASPDTFPPNPITKWFSVKKLVASAGPEFAWKVYDAVRIEDYKICSVFLFEKYIADKLHKPRRRDIVTNMLKREVKILSQLKHCYLLRVVHQIEENGDTLAFATEPVFASLANLLGNHTRLPTPVSPEIQKFRFTDLNRKLGIYQITEVLRFLHLGHSVFHNNICPGAILVTRSGQWRLASVSFLEAIKMDKKDNQSSLVLNPPGSTGKGKTLSLDLSASPWSRKLPKMARPDPHFAAPECLSLTTGWSAPFTSRWSRPSPEGQDVPFHEESGHNQPNKNKTRGSDIGSQGTTMTPASNHPGPWSDMFSLGLIICAVYKVGESAQTSYESQRRKRVREKPLAYITSAEEVENTTNLTGETAVEFSAEASRVEQLSTDSSIPEAFRTAVTRMPMGLVEPVEKMLSRSSQKRPSSQLFSLLKFFNDPSMLCLDVLLNFEEKAFEDRVRALQNIQHNVDRFSKELLLYRFLPMILDLLEKYHRRVTVHPNQTGKHKDDDLSRRGSLYRSDASQTSSNQDDRDLELIRKLMAALACIVQKSSPADYNEYIEQYVNEFVRRCKHVEVKAEILHNITAFTKHASVQSIEQLLVPILCDCLASHIPEVQIVAMESMQEMSGYFQQNELDDIVLTEVVQAYKKSVKNSPVQSQALRTLTTLVRQISVTALQEHLIPFLMQITKQQDVPKPGENRSTTSRSLRLSTEKLVDHERSTDEEPTGNQISTICEIWKSVTSTRANILEPSQVAKEIFPSILPHVLNKDLNAQEFRSVMSSLYALLDCLDLSVAGSEESVGATNYRIIPALTVDAPNLVEPEATSCRDSPPSFTISGSPTIPRCSMAREAVPFVPMLHPKQLKELEQSPGMSRRASAHVIFPLPPGTPVDAAGIRTGNLHTADTCGVAKELTPSSSVSFFGLHLPSVSQLRRLSYDTRGAKGQPDQINGTYGSNSIPKVEVQGSSESLSRRSSENSCIRNLRNNEIKDSFTLGPGGVHLGGMLDSSDSQLLTARVCEGPFISAPSSRPGSRRPSASSVSNWTLDPAPLSPRETESSAPGSRTKFLGTELRNVSSARRSSLNTLGDTVMNFLGNTKVQR